MRRRRRPGCDIAMLSKDTPSGSPPAEEIRIAAVSLAGESPAAMAGRLAREIAALDAAVIKHDVFAPSGAMKEFLRAWTEAAPQNDCPMTWVDCAPCAAGNPPAAMSLWAVSGPEVQTIRTGDGRPAGRTYADGFARYCLLGGIGPSQAAASPHAQARETFQNMLAALRLAGMEMTNVFRTWFYIDRILEWYGLFNEARTAFFRETGVFDALVPASTGIGGGNPAGSALVASCMAAAPVADFSARAIPSPLQGPAQEYGSAFARAVEVASGGVRAVYVSGTASITPNGRTAFSGDAAAQTELTMRVVEAILQSRGMGFGDVSRAIVYVKNPSDARVWEKWTEARNLTDMPAIVTSNDICRPDLLFEIEVDASARG